MGQKRAPPPTLLQDPTDFPRLASQSATDPALRKLLYDQYRKEVIQAISHAYPYPPEALIALFKMLRNICCETSENEAGQNLLFCVVMCIREMALFRKQWCRKPSRQLHAPPPLPTGSSQASNHSLARSASLTSADSSETFHSRPSARMVGRSSRCPSLTGEAPRPVELQALVDHFPSSDPAAWPYAHLAEPDAAEKDPSFRKINAIHLLFGPQAADKEHVDMGARFKEVSKILLSALLNCVIRDQQTGLKIINAGRFQNVLDIVTKFRCGLLEISRFQPRWLFMVMYLLQLPPAKAMLQYHEVYNVLIGGFDVVGDGAGVAGSMDDCQQFLDLLERHRSLFLALLVCEEKDVRADKKAGQGGVGVPLASASRSATIPSFGLEQSGSSSATSAPPLGSAVDPPKGSTEKLIETVAQRGSLGEKKCGEDDQASAPSESSRRDRSVNNIMKDHWIFRETTEERRAREQPPGFSPEKQPAPGPPPRLSAAEGASSITSSAGSPSSVADTTPPARLPSTNFPATPTTTASAATATSPAGTSSKSAGALSPGIMSGLKKSGLAPGNKSVLSEQGSASGDGPLTNMVFDKKFSNLFLHAKLLLLRLCQESPEKFSGFLRNKAFQHLFVDRIVQLFRQWTNVVAQTGAVSSPDHHPMKDEIYISFSAPAKKHCVMPNTALELIDVLLAMGTAEPATLFLDARPIVDALRPAVFELLSTLRELRDRDLVEAAVAEQNEHVAAGVMSAEEVKGSLRALVKRKERPNYAEFLRYAGEMGLSTLLRLAGLLAMTVNSESAEGGFPPPDDEVFQSFPKEPEAAISPAGSDHTNGGHGRELEEHDSRVNLVGLEDGDLAEIGGELGLKLETSQKGGTAAAKSATGAPQESSSAGAGGPPPQAKNISSSDKESVSGSEQMEIKSVSSSVEEGGGTVAPSNGAMDVGGTKDRATTTEASKKVEEEQAKLAREYGILRGATLSWEEMATLLNFCYSDHDLPLMKETAVYAVRNAAAGNEANKTKIARLLETRSTNAGPTARLELVGRS